MYRSILPIQDGAFCLKLGQTELSIVTGHVTADNPARQQHLGLSERKQARRPCRHPHADESEPEPGKTSPVAAWLICPR